MSHTGNRHVARHEAGPSRRGGRRYDARRRRSPWFTGGASLMIAAIGLAIAGFVSWAALARIPETARGRGQVIAAARTQVVDAVDGGVMQQLVVREGQHVQKGELLARLEDVRPRAAYEDSLTKVAQLRGTVSRLRAEVLGRELAFPAELEPYDDVRRNQRDLYERRQQVINEAVESLQRTLGLARREERIVERLLRTGDVGQTEFLRVKRQVTEIEGQIANLRNKYFQDAQADLTRAVEDLATQEQVLRERIALLEHTTLRSPTEGVIKKINVTTLGATLRPGETILEILPTDSDLIVEAKFPPAEIGALRVGMPASVKLDAWDYSIYGTLDGEIAYISPDALAETDPRSEDRYFFRVHVKLPDPSLPRPDEDRRRRPIGIKAGMTGTVDVRVDERTVLTYLAKPIVKTLVDSFRER